MKKRSRVDRVWDTAKKIRSKNPDVWRRDSLGNVIRKASHGTRGRYGWEIDHKKPLSKGGSDSPRNLQALHWEENRRKSNQYPHKPG